MSVLTGILVDVSGSMKENATGEINEEGGEWINSIFTVINDLIRHDVSSNNHMFAVAVGASCGSGIFDIIGTVKEFQSETHDDSTFDQIIEKTYLILECNGAYSVRKWAVGDVIKASISYEMASMILKKLESDPVFVRKFVYECLPPICRDLARDLAPLLPGPFEWLLRNAQHGVAMAANASGNIASEADIIEVVEKAKGFLLKDVGSECIVSVHTASEIVHGSVREDELSKERVKELMKTVEPFIYGRTPLFKALETTKQLFVDHRYRDQKKLLFVLSDGVPTDTGAIDDVIAELKEANVTVVSCFITKSRDIDPQRLYSSRQTGWEEGAQFLFKLSSTITTQLLPRTIFIKRGWKIDINGNETKLFLQVNHPKIMSDACDLARNVVCSQDSLSDILVSVSLDLYINQSTSSFGAPTQEKSTCYANASAAALHLAMKRIIGRDKGYPDFDTLRQEIIESHGQEGANTLHVLQTICPRYRLHCHSVDVDGAMQAVTAKRPVVAIFDLTGAQWDNFGEFYRKDPKGILRKKDLDGNRSRAKSESGGHAVVLTSYSSECFRLMNSWGNNWGDMGFFRVENAAVLGLEFIDVFWTPNDLSENEKANYQKHGSEIAATLMRNLTGLQNAKYECPLCNKVSLVTEFTGTLLQAVCPRCHLTFSSSDAGNILAMNMYLLSLTR